MIGDASIVEPLCLIFEKYVKTGIYPFVWKMANLVSISKKDSKQGKMETGPVFLDLTKTFDNVARWSTLQI